MGAQHAEITSAWRNALDCHPGSLVAALTYARLEDPRLVFARFLIAGLRMRTELTEHANTTLTGRCRFTSSSRLLKFGTADSTLRI